MESCKLQEIVIRYFGSLKIFPNEFKNFYKMDLYGRDPNSNLEGLESILVFNCKETFPKYIAIRKALEYDLFYQFKIQTTEAGLKYLTRLGTI